MYDVTIINAATVDKLLVTNIMLTKPVIRFAAIKKKSPL